MSAGEDTASRRGLGIPPDFEDPSPPVSTPTGVSKRRVRGDTGEEEGGERGEDSVKADERRLVEEDNNARRRRTAETDDDGDDEVEVTCFLTSLLEGRRAQPMAS